MAQILLIGLGGTGSRVVNNVVKELRKNKKTFNDGQICCAVLDTNVNDNRLIADSATGVPVFATSKAQKINQYFVNYRSMGEWCPQSPSFGQESMIDGASEIRMKSRIAFMDFIETGAANQLEQMVTKVLNSGEKSKIRIMIVSSLSGGTGSGMFIQVALWLRKILDRSDITIRGIFLLPDVFVKTIGDIEKNKKTSVRHYCNAYAAIRELNAITKIMKYGDSSLPERISLDKLFDSEKDSGGGKPVYDLAFFVDYRTNTGRVLGSISEYEKMAAQLVYMQLFAPMAGPMYSEEDNAFLAIEEHGEPLYGSCGTAKAVYPVESVKTYCAIRAAQDSLTGGWEKIDNEINELIAEKKEREKDGDFSGDAIDPREKYIKLFEEKTAVDADEVGKDRFFLSISRDTKNEEKIKGGDDKVTVRRTDKVNDFIKSIDTEKIDVELTRNSGTDDLAIDAEAFADADQTIEELMGQVRKDQAGFEEALYNFDRKVEGMAEQIVNSAAPYSMGDVNPKNRCSLYGLFTKPNDMGGWDFIHPVAARYILYRLAKDMENKIKVLVPNESRERALREECSSSLWDNAATHSATETTPLEYLESKKLFQFESKFINSFKERYIGYIATRIGLCEAYEKEALKLIVYRKMLDRINGLIGQLEEFFRGLDSVREKLEKGLDENIRETSGTDSGNTLYICGKQADKESIYRSLSLEVDSSVQRINRSVIDAIYGRFCAEKRPSNTENSKYIDVSATTVFVRETVETFRGRINGDTENREKVDMDIYTALCRERGMSGDSSGKRVNSLDSLDLTAGEVQPDNKEDSEREAAFRECVEKLKNIADVFLVYEKEIPDERLGTTTRRDKTFWGFNPELVRAFPQLGEVFGINLDTLQDSAYPKNELHCYRAVYGISPIYIPKFNEMNTDDGNYYVCYRETVSGMVEAAGGKTGERAYVSTPHLDKRWHRILPYVTLEKQESENKRFFRGFWLAVAYGIINTDRDGNIFVRRPVGGGYGHAIEENVAVMYEGKNVNKRDVSRLLKCLMSDAAFMGSDITRAEKRFKEELTDMSTYVGTEVLSGLTKKDDGLNSVNITVRYTESSDGDKNTHSSMVGALEEIAYEMVKSYNSARSEKQLEEAKYRICERIYESGTLVKKEEVFSTWVSVFKKMNKGDGSDGETSD